ncbi:ABC transporter ATP-binding protein [Pontibacter sp. BT310]|uniref:ABC transporter ATP-binding protein n=1 Tax=Pontibacter populi TaxID=890055 RepID=A0ABS6XF67_9BACT|nr:MULTISPECIES: ABC transporter ATP-binding protein [Pontibacter]MBJ6119784.1 ABC transporter ATP-binding protein [Pontibacter sp. BT310]MBR0572213.1 ABC transporter ATP-binding protein [Microvirga sp. STS03]MBW3366637.1 ABC transporter ATP-binding protein [Pontibacter populi]
MIKNVIEVTAVSKQYRLGLVGTGTLSHDLNRWWHLVRGKEDPYLKIGEENDRTLIGNSEYVWALRDVNLNVKDGEVMGIIGRNGAGKSTLLKLLSRTTAPTTGSIKIKGRVASLLEVGTGFHPELSGRDNIYLNGAILGMTRQEITRKFDEIVEFAGVERYVDTPVKRYSSGMYVRLAFAVAAHLEPEILIVDEVLAVGDAEFQKKCLGKMKDVSTNQGRTVLFVSHNMTAIKNLCNTVAYMKNGKVVMVGETENVINTYLSDGATNDIKQEFASPEEAPGNDAVKLKRIEIVPILDLPHAPITVETPIDVEFEFWNYVDDKPINLSLHLYTMNNECVFNVGSESMYLTKGVHKGVCRIPEHLLNDGSYSISMMIVAERSYALYNFEDVVMFEVHENRAPSGWHGKRPGFVRPKLDFKLV